MEEEERVRVRAEEERMKREEEEERVKKENEEVARMEAELERMKKMIEEKKRLGVNSKLYSFLFSLLLIFLFFSRKLSNTERSRVFSESESSSPISTHSAALDAADREAARASQPFPKKTKGVSRAPSSSDGRLSRCSSSQSSTQCFETP